VIIQTDALPQLPAECAILCLAYIERLISHTNVTLHASNWRRIVLSALILASKGERYFPPPIYPKMHLRFASCFFLIFFFSLLFLALVWEDQAVWNVDFLSVFPNVTVQDLKVLEKKLLGYIQYNVNVTGGLYVSSSSSSFPS